MKKTLEYLFRAALVLMMLWIAYKTMQNPGAFGFSQLLAVLHREVIRKPAAEGCQN